MTKPTLLVLAAGMGSRYGGLKQIDPIGPSGESLMDYSIYDALRAGFGKLVFVIRRDIEQAFKEKIGARFESRLPVEYAFQELDALPPGFSLPPGRRKPWGTGHAVLTGAAAISEPFAAINADDFYGRHSFELLSRHLQAGTGEHAMVGFVLRNTLSEHGAVARGVCSVSADDLLESATELTRVEPHGEGAVNTDPSGRVSVLTGKEIVSLNMWGFLPCIFDHLRHDLSRFLERHLQDEKAEFYIPSAVNNLITASGEKVRVLRTPDSWFGITYREDRTRVIESIGRLVRDGEYPVRLWL